MPDASCRVSAPTSRHLSALARATFDLTTVERLRFMAADLRTKAEELEDEEEILQAHMIQGSSFSESAGESDRD